MTLNLFFPQWQGSGEPELALGATMMRERLRPLEFVNVPLARGASLDRKHDVLAYDPIVWQLQQANTLLEQHQPSRVRMLAGDCGCELAPIAYLSKLYDGDLAVVWFDGHGDLNTPATSPSKTFHGMGLRALCGEGDGGVLALNPRPLRPEQVVLVGVRDLDAGELAFVQRHGITLLSPEALRENPGLLSQTLGEKGFKHTYIHFDLDAIDPLEFPFTYWPAPNGLGLAQSIRLVRSVLARGETVGFSFTELALHNQSEIAGLEELLELFKEAISL
jgi:arginase